MALSVNWNTFVISVPKADMTLVQSTPTEIRELDLNTFRLELKDIEDDNDGIVYSRTHNHNAPVTVGGVTLARVVEILSPYTVTFEDGQYAVNLVGANSNVGDKTNVNQVSVRSANSAGLVQTSEIEYASFAGGVHIDVINGAAGQAYPLGSPESPVNNLADALFIANLRGFDTIFVKGDYTFGSGDTVDDFNIVGQSPNKSSFTLGTAASITNCNFSEASLSGALDGGCSLTNCHVNTLDYVDGDLHGCTLESGTITLNGTEASLIDCVSGVPGVATPIIDFNGGGTDLVVRNYAGGIELRNHTSGSDNVSVDLNSGHVILDSTISSGTFVIRGVGKLTNNSTGSAVIIEEILDSRNLNRTLFTDGAVYLDTGIGTSGTVFPQGTPAKPVSNLADALTVMNANGLHRINLVGFVVATASHNLDGVLVTGGSGSSNVIGLSGCSTVSAGFDRLIVYGAFNGISRIQNCILGTTGLGGVTGTEGRIVDCIINHADGITQNSPASPAGAGTLFDNCSFIAPNNPQITLNANGKGFSLRNCTGNILITNKTDTEEDQVHVEGATIEIAASCTAGSIVLSGSGTLTDNSLGTAVVSTDLVVASSITELHGQTTRSVYIDTEAVTNGNGYQQNPFNNFTSAVDYAEANGLKELVLLADATIDRQLKNFIFTGVGNPTIDCNNQIIDKSEFRDLKLGGTIAQTGNGSTIRAHNCSLEHNITGLRGDFFNCGFGGDLYLASSISTTMIDCYSEIGGLSRPTVTVNGGTSNVSIRSYRGGLTIKGVNTGDETTVSMSQGKLTIDPTCIGGVISVRGTSQFTDNSAGSTIDVTGLINTENNILAIELAEADQFFDKSTGLLHYYRRGTSPPEDIIPPKTVSGEQVTTDVNILE